MLNPVRAYFGKWHSYPYYCNKHDNPSPYSSHSMGLERYLIQDGQLIYSMILSFIQFDSSFYFLKLRSYSTLNILYITNHQRLHLLKYSNHTCIQKPFKYTFSSDLLFQINFHHRVYWTLPMKVHSH